MKTLRKYFQLLSLSLLAQAGIAADAALIADVPSTNLADETKRSVVRLPNGLTPDGRFDQQSIDVAAGLAVCANFQAPERRGNLDTAQACVDDVKTAIRIGQISDMPALALALRQIPFVGTDGGDNVAAMSTVLASTIEQPIRAYGAALNQFLAEVKTNPQAVQPRPIYRVNYNGSSQGPINTAPFTADEIDAVSVLGDGVPSAAQTFNRQIPMDTAATYLMIAADTVIRPEHYTTEGLSVAQTIAAARTRTPAALDAEIGLACFINDRSKLLSNGGVADVPTCRASAARTTLEAIANGEAAPYEPARYSNSPRFAAKR